MKSEELRIGNLLLFKNLAVVGVESIHKYGINGGEGHIWDDLFPIPLSEKWLLEFGFVNNYNNQSKYGWWKDGDFKIVSSAQTFYISINNKEVPIKYVHELQNLYRCLNGIVLQL